MSRAVMIALLAGACSAPVDLPRSAVGQPAPPRPPGGGGVGPALGVFPPNATRVIAKVLRHGTATAEYLPAQPEIAAGTRLDVLTLAIEDARQARPDLAMGPATGAVQASSPDPLNPALVGHRIEAVLTLVGTTRASRWLISDIRTLPD